MLGRTKDQIRTTKQVHAALNTCQTLDLDGLLIIGGTILVWLIWANIFFLKIGTQFVHILFFPS